MAKCAARFPCFAVPSGRPIRKADKEPKPSQARPNTLKAETITQYTMPGERLAERESRVAEEDRSAYQTRRTEWAEEER